MPGHRRFTIRNVLVVLFLLVLVVAVLLPALGAARRSARSMQTNTQILGIHQSCYTFSQSNGGWFPGLDAEGHPIDPTTRYRFELLLTHDFFTGEYAVSPVEARPIWTDPATPITSEHYSYAMLEIARPGARRASWRDDMNKHAPLITDRNAGTDPTTDLYSIHTSPGSGRPDWRGLIAWGDNHHTFETTHRFDTRMGPDRVRFNDDHLFESQGPDDALMQHSP